ncbi:MAG: MFS transporter [Micromonosporaceae bacterium]|nr:MFS transporter [Micromonosporaceae bacterium]
MATGSQSTAVPTRIGHGLRAIVAAGGISAIGDGAFLAAAPLAAAAITRDPAGVTVVSVAEYLPWLLVTPFAGVWVDRWPRRSTMITADLLRGIAVAALAVLVGTGTATIPAIALCAGGMVTGMVFHSAAAETLIADLTDRSESQLPKINGRLQAASTTGRQLVGPPAGSWSFALAGWLPFAADALSFLGSAMILIAVPPSRAARAARQRMWPALREGMAYLAGHRELRTLALLTAAGNISVAAGMATLVLFATDPGGLGVTTSAYGLLLATMAAGGVLGGFIAAPVIRRFGDRMTVLAGLSTEIVGWLLLSATHEPILAGALLALLWISFSVLSVVIMGSRQRQTPPDLLGRVISAFRIVGNGTSPLGALAAGIAATWWGLRAPMLVAAALLAVAVVLAVSGFRRR